METIALEDSYADYFARGGKITVVPGFEGCAPLPQANRPVKKKAPVKKPKGLMETADGVTLLWIAIQCGYQARTSLGSNHKAMAYVPNPIGVVGRHKQHIYDKTAAKKAVTEIKRFRNRQGRTRRSVAGSDD